LDFGVCFHRPNSSTFLKDEVLLLPSFVAIFGS